MSTGPGLMCLNILHFQHQGHDVYKDGVSVTGPLILSSSGTWCLQVRDECDWTFNTFNVRDMVSTSTGLMWLNILHFQHQAWCLQVRGDDCDWTFDTFNIRDMMSTSTGWWVWLNL